jgi:hypothetical protein
MCSAYLCGVLSAPHSIVKEGPKEFLSTMGVVHTSSIRPHRREFLRTLSKEKLSESAT